MKWMLVIMVMGTTPVKTDLLFDSLQLCLSAEDAMRDEYAEAWNQWHKWAQANPKDANYPDSREFMTRRIGIPNFGTCIPHVSPANSN